MRKLAPLFVLFLASPAWAQEKDKPVVIFPAHATVAADAPVKLDDGTVYIIRGTVDFMVISVPEGIVNATMDIGARPYHFFARFSDGDGTYQPKDFTEKVIWIVQPKAVGTCWLVIVEGKNVTRKMIEVTGARPPPGPPTPKPEPPGPNPPTPPKADKLALVVVWESADSTPAIAAVMKDLAFWNGLKAQGHQFFQIDRDQKDKDGQLLIDTHKYRPYVDAKGLPVLIVMGGDGLVLESLRLPGTKDEITALVKKWTGK